MKIYGFLENDDKIQDGDEILFEVEWEEIDDSCIGKTYKEFIKNICVPDNEIIQIRRKLFDSVNEMLKFIFPVDK